MKSIIEFLQNIKVIAVLIVSVATMAFGFGTWLGNTKADIRISEEQNKKQEIINNCSFDKQKLEIEILNLKNENRWLSIAKNDLKGYIELKKVIEDDPTEDNFIKLDKIETKVKKIK